MAYIRSTSIYNSLLAATTTILNHSRSVNLRHSSKATTAAVDQAPTGAASEPSVQPTSSPSTGATSPGKISTKSPKATWVTKGLSGNSTPPVPYHSLKNPFLSMRILREGASTVGGPWKSPWRIARDSRKLISTKYKHGNCGHIHSHWQDIYKEL